MITCATSGIGLELARLFAQDQHNVILVARDQNELDNTAREIYNGEIILSFEPERIRSVVEGNITLSGDEGIISKQIN